MGPRKEVRVLSEAQCAGSSPWVRVRVRVRVRIPACDDVEELIRAFMQGVLSLRKQREGNGGIVVWWW